METTSPTQCLGGVVPFPVKQYNRDVILCFLTRKRPTILSFNRGVNIALIIRRTTCHVWITGIRIDIRSRFHLSHYSLPSKMQSDKVLTLRSSRLPGARRTWAMAWVQ